MLSILNDFAELIHPFGSSSAECTIIDKGNDIKNSITCVLTDCYSSIVIVLYSVRLSFAKCMFHCLMEIF